MLYNVGLEDVVLGRLVDEILLRADFLEVEGLVGLGHAESGVGEGQVGVALMLLIRGMLLCIFGWDDWEL